MRPSPLSWLSKVGHRLDNEQLNLDRTRIATKTGEVKAIRDMMTRAPIPGFPDSALRMQRNRPA
jgi:hypothetical protein